MMLRWLLLLACSIGTFTDVLAQSPYFNPFKDSILPKYRVAGDLDSVDIFLAQYPTNVPRTNWLAARSFLDWRSLSAISIPNYPKRFSAIPHIGLQYAMGTNATQRSGLSYTQSLSKGTFVQLDYRRTSTNGAMRNSGNEINQVNLQLLARKKRFASDLQVNFFGQQQKLNGGLLGDTSVVGFPLEFQEVERADAASVRKNFSIDWSNYIAFNSDSLTRYGIYVSPQFTIRNKRFTESGNTDQLYGVVNLDSLKTADFWEHSQIGVENGFFYHQVNKSFSVGLNSAYWQFDNFSNKSDTVELTLVGDWAINFGTLNWIGKLSNTFTGANGQRLFQTQLANKGNRFNWSAKFNYQRAYPLVEQRTYLANSISYSWNNRVLSDRIEGSFSAYSNVWKVPVSLTFFGQQLNKMPLFIGNQWRQDTLKSLSVVQFHLRCELIRKSFFFQPAVILRASNQKYIPAFTGNARVGFKGGLFRAKKMIAAIGVDLGYSSSFTLLDYEFRIDALVLPSKQVKYTPMPKLHVFGQFEIGMMRWFLRVENIEQLFINKENQEVLGYPVLPLQLRIGLTWDLFN